MSKPEQCPCGRLRPTPHFAQELLLWTYQDQPHSQRTSLLWEALETMAQPVPVCLQCHLQDTLDRRPSALLVRRAQDLLAMLPLLREHMAGDGRSHLFDYSRFLGECPTEVSHGG